MSQRDAPYHKEVSPALPALPGEAWALLSTAQGLPTAALRSCSTARSGVGRQRGCAGGPSLTGRALAERQRSRGTSERSFGRGAAKSIPFPELRASGRRDGGLLQRGRPLGAEQLVPHAPPALHQG